MGFINYGSRKALGHRVDFQGAIANMVEQERLTNAAIQQRKQEVQYYSEKMKTATSDIPSVQARLDEFNKKKLNEIGRYTVENPDFELDVTKMAEFNRMTSDLLNNDILAEAEMSKRNYEEFRAAYENKELTNEEFVQYSKAWEKYEQEGNDGNPFQFVKPERVPMADIIAESTANIALQLGDPEVVGGMRGQRAFVDDERLYQAATSAYADPRYRASVQTHFKNMNGMYSSPEEMLFDMFKGSYSEGFKAQAQDQLGIINAKTAAELKLLEAEAQVEGSVAVPNYSIMVPAVLRDGESTNSIRGASTLTDAGLKGFNLNEHHWAIEVGEGQYQRVQDLAYPATVLNDGAGRVFNVGGSRFVSVDIAVKAPQSAREQMEKYGFNPNFSLQPAMEGVPQVIWKDELNKSPEYTRTIIMPAREGYNNLLAFEQAQKTDVASLRRMKGRLAELGLSYTPGENYPPANPFGSETTPTGADGQPFNPLNMDLTGEGGPFN